MNPIAKAIPAEANIIGQVVCTSEVHCCILFAIELVKKLYLVKSNNFTTSFNFEAYFYPDGTHNLWNSPVVL